MNITPYRRRHAPPGTGGRVLGSSLALVAVVAAAMSGPAALASPSAPNRSVATRAVAIKPKPGTISWSVIPASATAPQATRNMFSYTKIKPGSTITDHVAVVNRSAQSVAFTIYATDASGTTQNNSLILLPAAKKPVDIGSWVTLAHHVAKLSVVIPAKTAVIEPF